jgi:putative acetyltransferase
MKKDIGHITLLPLNIFEGQELRRVWVPSEVNMGGKECEVDSPDIEIRPLRAGEDGSAFRTLNEEWIAHYFALEQKDRETLGDPENAILHKGGHIFMVYANGNTVGCVALIPIGNDVYELSKMAVSPQLRGHGIGRKLLEYTVAQAKEIGAKALFLGSNTRLENAIHLYESVGFRHVPAEKLPPMQYTRANVFMEMQL